MLHIYKRFTSIIPLFLALVRRDVATRYRASVLGASWQIISPVLLLLVYGFVFGLIFQVRWGGAPEEGGSPQFIAALFCGLSVFGFFSDVLNRSPGLIHTHVTYVKKVVFPLGLLSAVCVSSAAWTFLINLLLLLTFLLVTGQGPSSSITLIPIVLLPFILILLGLSWFLAALGVYVRDIAHVTGFVTTATLFLSPVFYPLDAVPEAYRWILYANPLTFVLDAFRGLAMFGTFPALSALIAYWALALIVAAFGYVWFRKLRAGFADVL